MTRRLHANNYSSTLATNITASATSITVSSATGLPAIGTNETFRLTLSSINGAREIVIVTDDASSPILTVTRGAEGTTPQVFLAGANVQLQETADSYDRKQDAIATTGDVINFGDATSLEIPNSAAPSMTVTGQIALDTSVTDFADGLPLLRQGSTTYALISIPLSGMSTPTNNYVVTYDATADQFKLAAGGGGGGGSGDVVGPASSTDNAVTRFDSTTGKLIQNSGAILDDNGNLTTNNMSPAYTTTATAAGTTTLTVASTQQQFFTGSTTQTVVLPVTSTLSLGFQFRIVNNSSGSVTVQSSGANSVQVMAANTSAIFTVILTSGTTAASWSVSYFSTGGGGSQTPWTSNIDTGGYTLYNNTNGNGVDIKGSTTGGSPITLTCTYLDIKRATGSTTGSAYYMYEAPTSGSRYIGFQAPTSISASYTVTLPSAGGTGFLYSTSNTWALTTTPAIGTPASGTMTNVTGLPLTTGVTGILPVANGGTGRNTATTAYGIIAAGTTAAGVQQTISPGTSGYLLASTGSSSLAAFSKPGSGMSNIFVNTSSTLSIATTTFTKVPLNNEVVDANGDFNNTTYRHQPTIAGNYFYYGVTGIDTGTTVAQVQSAIYKNGVSLTSSVSSSSSAGFVTVDVSSIVPMNGTTDYVELYCYQATGTSKPLVGFATCNFLQGILL